MEAKGQAGSAVIWGAGCILAAVGLVLLLSAYKDRIAGSPELALLEGIIGAILLGFGVISFYMAYRSTAG